MLPPRVTRHSVDVRDTRLALVAPLEYNTDARCLLVQKSNPRSALVWNEEARLYDDRVFPATGIVLFPNFHFRVRLWVYVTEDRFVDFKGNACSRDAFIARLAQSLDYLYRKRHLVNDKITNGSLYDAQARCRTGITPGTVDTVRAVMKIREYNLPPANARDSESHENDFVRVRALPDFERAHAKLLGPGIALDVQCRHHVVALALLHAFAVPEFTALKGFRGGFLTLGKGEYLFARTLVYTVVDISKNKTKTVWTCPEVGKVNEHFLHTVLPRSSGLTEAKVRFETGPHDEFRSLTTKWSTCSSLALFDHHLSYPPQVTSGGGLFLEDCRLVDAACVLYGGVVSRGECGLQNHMSVSFDDLRMRKQLLEMAAAAEEEVVVVKAPEPATAPPPKPTDSARLENQRHAKRIRLMRGEIPYLNFYALLKKMTFQSDMETLFHLDEKYHEDEFKKHLEVWIYADMPHWKELMESGAATQIVIAVEKRFPPLSNVREKYESVRSNYVY